MNTVNQSIPSYAPLVAAFQDSCKLLLVKLKDQQKNIQQKDGALILNCGNERKTFDVQLEIHEKSTKNALSQNQFSGGIWEYDATRRDIQKDLDCNSKNFEINILRKI